MEKIYKMDGKEIAKSIGLDTHMSDEELEALVNNTNVDVAITSDKIVDKNNTIPTEDIKEIQGSISIDPILGTSMVDTKPFKVEDISLSDILDEAEKKPEDFKDTFQYMFGEVSEKELLEILDFIKKVEKEKPKKLFNLLPRVIKNAIYETVDNKRPSMNELETMAHTFYNMCVSELKTDKAFIDLDTALSKELDELKNPDYMKIYLDHIRDVMENKLEESAKRIEGEFPEKAKIFRGISKSFKDAYTYERLIKKIQTKGKIIQKELKKEIKNFNHLAKKINAKYIHSKFIIIDTQSLPFILNRKLPEKYTVDDITMFLTLLLKSFRKLNPDNMVDHSYIYYGIKCIASLDEIKADDHEFKNEIINNICNVIEMIKNPECN